MARQAWAVIGAAYGDEGKGLMTDALAEALGPSTLVVRSNGGAQAGHTVVTPDGRRHVFHHVGSGALAGAATHLSRCFVHQPMLLGEEVRALRAFGARLDISADPRGYVTTPWDMMVNQIAEQARGNARHGSCGLGFGETVGRCEETDYALTVADLTRSDLAGCLRAIQYEWLPSRLAALGLDRLDAEQRELLSSEAILERYVEDTAAFLRVVRLADDSSIGRAEAVIFEGAQGLLLDQDQGVFPHVTRSRTGIANPLSIAEEAGIECLDVLYVTRCYLTRHGRGPMADERDLAPDFAVVDPTNRPNPWQGRLRLGYLDLDLLARAIAADTAVAGPPGVRTAAHLGVTCLDQARGRIPFRCGGGEQELEARAFVSLAREAVDAATVLTSSGPSRRDVDMQHALLGQD